MLHAPLHSERKVVNLSVDPVGHQSGSTSRVDPAKPFWSHRLIDLDPKSTALVLIDLQNGILGYPLVPTSAQDLLERGKALAEQFRAAGATVALVNVVGSPNSGDLLRQVDEPTPRPSGQRYPALSAAVRSRRRDHHAGMPIGLPHLAHSRPKFLRMKRAIPANAQDLLARFLRQHD